uniref:Uncharacterized protein n=1 Tax=Clandestinovirus TaxID=2831644 RepID=A0A8F8KLG4_9VIRU|nr:hypothetical protein KOM_12_12 [Clandestinovirus]
MANQDNNNKFADIDEMGLLNSTGFPIWEWDSNHNVRYHGSAIRRMLFCAANKIHKEEPENNWEASLFNYCNKWSGRSKTFGGGLKWSVSYHVGQVIRDQSEQCVTVTTNVLNLIDKLETPPSSQ